MSAPVVQAAPHDGTGGSAPFLAPDTQAEASRLSNEDVRITTPLTKRQVFLLSIASLSDPVIINFTYPFINERIGSTSNSPEQVARRSGLIVGSFALAQFCSVYVWGTLSDRVGRKPVLITCLIISFASTVGFGAVRTFWEFLIMRIITGTSYGDVPVIRSALGDITDSTNQARAFSFIPLCYMIGATIAPLIGGFLSHPERHFPKLFKKSQYFLGHPYALPCFVAALVPAAALILITVFFRETLFLRPSASGIKVEEDGHEENSLLSSRGDYAPRAEYGSTGVTNSAPRSQSRERTITVSVSQAEEQMDVWKILKDPIVRGVLVSYALLSLISTSNDNIFSLWMYLSVDRGGIGLTIATVLSTGSVMGALVLTFVFPPLHRKVGTLKLYRIAMAFDFIFILLYPAVHAIAAATTKVQLPTGAEPQWQFANPPYSKVPGVDPEPSWGEVSFRAKFGVGIMLVVKAIAGLTWGCNMILVTAAAPSASSLGKVNSLAQMAASAARTVGPPVYASILAMSINRDIVPGGNWLIWVFMGVIALISLAVSFIVQEGDRPWRRLNPSERVLPTRSEPRHARA